MKNNLTGSALLTLLLGVSHVTGATLFVSFESKVPVSPFADWPTAATNIQQAVNAASPGDEIVVTNGVYGGVVVDKAVLVRSVNGPLATTLDPAGQSRCAWLASGARITGFTFTRGTADVSGGGVFCAASDTFLTNCIIKEGQTSGSGGGVYGGTLYNCMVVSNSAAIAGGGAMNSTLYNCTVVGNRAASSGGGVHNSSATNCILYFNTAGSDENHRASSLSHCCTIPLPLNGDANVTNAPVFVDSVAGDLRQMGTSTCIDAGEQSVVATATDLGGYPRIMRSTVDIGAYEFQGTNALVFYAWVQHHGILIDGLSDYGDPDGDGLNNWQEWVCYTCPTNPALNLKMVSATPNGLDVTVRWKSAVGVKYFLERGTNPASPFTLIASNLLGLGSETTYTHTNAAGPGPFYYRVFARPPL